MEQIKQEYYPKDKKFTEISIKFLGDRMKPADVIFYYKLKSLNKKLKLAYPEFVIQDEFYSIANFIRYECSSILEKNTEKTHKIKAICDELIKYGIKNNSVPMIEFINYGEKTTIYTLEDYLKNKGIKLEELNIEEVSENLEEIRE